MSLEMPTFTIVPPPRCQAPRSGAPSLTCGEPARWATPASRLFLETYVCDRHRTPMDVEIPKTVIFRRVRVEVVVDFFGVSLHGGTAQAEAVSRLEEAVRAVGGVPNLLNVSSTIGRGAVTVTPSPASAKQGRG